MREVQMSRRGKKSPEFGVPIIFDGLSFCSGVIGELDASVGEEEGFYPGV
jgi:hypothetical protein